MNAEQQAINEWFESASGKRCSDFDIMKQCTNPEYLNDRLWEAFTAGLSAGKEIMKDRMKKKLNKLVDE